MAQFTIMAEKEILRVLPLLMQRLLRASMLVEKLLIKELHIGVQNKSPQYSTTKFHLS